MLFKLIQGIICLVPVIAVAIIISLVIVDCMPLPY